MVSLDFAWLDGLGLGALSEDDKRSLLEAVYEELEMRTGARLVQGMTTEQLSEFDALMDAGDEQAAKHWLDESVPGYPQMVEGLLEEMAEELRSRCDEVLQDRRA